MVKLLMESGADPNSLSQVRKQFNDESLGKKLAVTISFQNSFTPLYMAAQEGHADVVDYLIDHGADHTIATEVSFM